MFSTLVNAIKTKKVRFVNNFLVTNDEGFPRKASAGVHSENPGTKNLLSLDFFIRRKRNCLDL
jgi:hypothetical protein